jgi:cytoskeleton protein RodZ
LEYNTSMAQTIGQQLQQTREAQGFSLEELSQKTHIKVPYLKALEEGNIEALPSQTHLRGFLRLYAATLGVELDDLISSASAADEQEETHDEVVEPSPQEEEISQETTETSPSENNVISRIIEYFKKLFKGKEPKPENITPEPVSEASPPETTDNRTSAEIFTEISKHLLERRNLISLSLDDVESQTHIRKHFLSAIEAGQFDKLPSPVQARGMLANYAAFLSLDVDTILLDYADGLQKKRLETQEIPPQKKTAKEISPGRLRLKNFFSLDLLVIAAIFLVFAGFVIWGINRILSTDSTVASPTDLPDVSDVLLATATPTPDSMVTVEETQTSEVTESQTGVESTPIPTSIPNNSAIAIVVIPIQNAWIKITSDGEMVYEGRVLTGNAYDYYADDQLELLTGSAGALQVYFNEQDIGSIGLIGQVSTLVFTPNGLVMPTATSSPTPTLTPQDSVTPSITPSPTSTEPDNNDIGS